MVQEEIRRNRLRVRKACEICKRRKVKCDGSQPCANCVKHGQECKYISGTVRRRYRRDIGNSSGASILIPSRLTPSSSTALNFNGSVNGGGSEILGNNNGVGDSDRMASLLLQLGGNGTAGIWPPVSLDSERINANTSAIRHLIKTTNSVGYNNRRSPWQSFSLDKYRFHRRYQNLLPFYLGASLMSEIPQHAVESHRLKQPRIQNYGWNMSGGHYLRHDKSSKARARARARAEGANLDPEGFFDFENPVHLSVVNKLLKFYFKEINPPMSIVHESMFWQQFNNRFLPHTNFKDSSSKLFRSMLYLILAITLRFREGFMENTEGSNEFLFTWEELSFFQRQHREEAMFKYAYSVITQLTFEWESFELIQSWLLITFYFRTCYRQTACWNALGQAINMCNGMSLYLNRFPRTHSKYDESRAWHCFWACFIMDKLISFQMGRFYQLSMPVSHMTTPGHWCDNKVDVDRNGNSNAEDDDNSIWSDASETTNDESDDSSNVEDVQEVDHNDRQENGEHPQGEDVEKSNTPQYEDDGKEDDWFHHETTQLFELAVIVQTCQKRDGEELDLEESIALRRKLDEWFEKHIQSTRIDKTWQHLYQIQPLLSYLDVRLTFETRRLFLLINQPLDTGEMIFPIDTLGLVKHCQLSVKVLSQINQKQLYFIPWWLNLSQLFTASVISIALIHSGLQTSRSLDILRRCMDIWNNLMTSHPKNPPGMLPECLWCIKMLNHMCCLRLLSSATHLENLVGTNPGDSTPNDNKFSQFGKVGEMGKAINSDDESGSLSNLPPIQSQIPYASPSIPQSQPIRVKSEPSTHIPISTTAVKSLAENQFKITPQSQPHPQPQPQPQPGLSEPILGQGSGTMNTPQASEDFTCPRMGNIPSSSITDSSGIGNKENSEAIDEGLFSYLQWFDQNFM
ncbi:hypothetical protein ZYGR_0P02440 [Zygosaccharomyces rouxii]|uniref:Zn(2)-C6 fungal-type domain-containing protein n=1 Tax=Zygosaccharomyces rouxii TaxID=4956 RepID=A0A1Q3A1R5_ZYGRO|nr:hypothetical protein ZYGR_0P02440 [Zygosaccharomyces rouxii]